MQNMEGKTALGLDTGIGVLICYFGNLACGLPLGLIYSILVIVQDKTNKVARFHAFQSLFLMIAGAVIIGPLIFIVMFAGVLIDAMIGLPIVSILGGLLLTVLGLAMAVFVILAAIKGFGGEIYKVPVIGNFAEKYANG
jgi:uncharacterized membrane protein